MARKASQPVEDYPPTHPLATFRTVMVTGWDDWVDHEFVDRSLDLVADRFGCDGIVTTDETGVAAFALDWAHANRLPYVTWPENKAYGTARDIGRAAMMLRRSRPTLLLAFPGGLITRWLIANAARASIPVKCVDYGKNDHPKLSDAG